MRLCSDFLNWLKAEFQQIYIFTLLALLYYLIVHVIAEGEFDLKPEVESLLNQGSGGIIAMMTMIVQNIFGGKNRQQSTRSGDGASADPLPPISSQSPLPAA